MLTLTSVCDALNWPTNLLIVTRFACGNDCQNVICTGLLALSSAFNGQDGPPAAATPGVAATAERPPATASAIAIPSVKNRLVRMPPLSLDGTRRQAADEVLLEEQEENDEWDYRDDRTPVHHVQ